MWGSNLEVHREIDLVMFLEENVTDVDFYFLLRPLNAHGLRHFSSLALLEMGSSYLFTCTSPHFEEPLPGSSL